MKKVKDKHLLAYYINKYCINDIFSIDMTPYMDLLFYNKNEHICKVNETLDYLYFFVDGKAKVYTLLSNGKSLLLSFYVPFKIIGDIELLNTNIANSNIQVIESCYVIAIPILKIKEYTISDPKFLRFICNSLSVKLIKISNHSSINLLYPLENRLASYIIAYMTNKKELSFNENLTQVSELLGTSYRHLLRTLNKFSEIGAIQKDEMCYKIINVELLQQLALDLYN